MTTEEPLIYTSRGNLPIASLDYQHAWFEDDNCIALVETYRLDGEIVKQSRHVKIKEGLPLFGESSL